MKDDGEFLEKIIEDLDASDLNENQKKFILYYLTSYNATQSYLKAYPNIKERHLATLYANRLLHKDNVRAVLKKLRKLFQIEYDIEPTRYLEFLLKAAYADMGDYIKFAEEEIPVYDKDGMQMVDPETGEGLTRKVNRMHLVDSDSVDTSLITGIRQGKDGITITLVDKLRSWEKLKEFFEWKREKEQKAISDSNIINAIKSRVKEMWTGEEDENKDLDIVVKE